jgi:hypothetical protein
VRVHARVCAHVRAGTRACVCVCVCVQLGVCNVTVQIENLDRELGDHYPTFIDEETGVCVCVCVSQALYT